MHRLKRQSDAFVPTPTSHTNRRLSFEGPAMPIPMTASEVLDREFLEIRAKILELAASFDRLDRADGAVAGDPRLSLVHEALDVLKSEADDRAEQVQLIFSLHYDDEWQKKFDLASGR